MPSSVRTATPPGHPRVGARADGDVHGRVVHGGERGPVGRGHQVDVVDGAVRGGERRGEQEQQVVGDRLGGAPVVAGGVVVHGQVGLDDGHGDPDAGVDGRVGGVHGEVEERVAALFGVRGEVLGEQLDGVVGVPFGLGQRGAHLPDEVPVAAVRAGGHPQRQQPGQRVAVGGAADQHLGRAGPAAQQGRHGGGTLAGVLPLGVG
ncbi:hypothetical protein, partial [Micromonospora harpali]